MDAKLILGLFIVEIILTFCFFLVFKRIHGLSIGKFYKHLFSLMTAVLIALISWPFRALLNWIGYKINICKWLDRHFPLPEEGNFE